jgi:hypothetical protein
MRRWVGLVTVLLLAGPATARAAEPADARRRNIVLLTVDGTLPADSSDAAALLEGMREAFEPDFFLTEGVPGGPSRVSMPLANRFRRVYGDPFGDEWQVRVTIAAWPTPGAAPGDTTAGFHVGVSVRSPEAVESGARPDTVGARLTFAVPRSPRPAWFSHAGRAAALLVIETLHRRSGDLESDTRVRMDRTVREPIGGRGASTPAR